MEAILLEIRSLREELRVLRAMVEPARCKGVTGKGTPCRNKAGANGEYCGMHTGVCKPIPKEEKPKKPKKPKKLQPEHTHGNGMPCELCESHGDVWNPGLIDEEFEGVA
jgi:hypothetical protein